MYKNTWIVVANSSKARILKANSNTELAEQFTLNHEESRMKGSEINTDRPGRTFDSKGPARHAMGNTVDVKTEQVIEFAKEVTNKIDDIRNKDTIEQLFIIASPEFLGHLTKNLNGNLQNLLQGKIDKDLTSHKLEEVRTYLPEVL